MYFIIYFHYFINDQLYQNPWELGQDTEWGVLFTYVGSRAPPSEILIWSTRRKAHECAFSTIHWGDSDVEVHETHLLKPSYVLIPLCYSWGKWSPGQLQGHS